MIFFLSAGLLKVEDAPQPKLIPMGQEQPIVECWVFDITGKPSDELRHILRKLQADDPGGAKRRRILTYLTKVRTLCARAYGAPAIRGPIRDSYLSFLSTRVH